MGCQADLTEELIAQLRPESLHRPWKTQVGPQAEGRAGAKALRPESSAHLKSRKEPTWLESAEGKAEQGDAGPQRSWEGCGYYIKCPGDLLN